jgi:hypothetical protein
MEVCPLRGPGKALCVGVAVLLLPGCGRAGEETTRIDEAEVEIVEVVDAIVEAVALDVAREEQLSSRVGCELVTTGEGASNEIGRYGPMPQVDDPVARASAVLVEHGYELRDSDLEEGVFGRRDGIRITVVADRATGELAIDANTGCRPLPQ